MISTPGDGPGPAAATRVVAAVLADLQVPYQRTGERLFSVTLPGTRKLQTECAIEIGTHVLGLRAFVIRRPEENHDQVYRWLLQRNLRLSMISFSVDRLNDVYLTGRIPVSAVGPGLLDTVLGSVATTADDSFNVLLSMGFASSITGEWAWRRSRGESTENLAAFTQLAPPSDEEIDR